MTQLRYNSATGTWMPDVPMRPQEHQLAQMPSQIRNVPVQYSAIPTRPTFDGYRPNVPHIHVSAPRNYVHMAPVIPPRPPMPMRPQHTYTTLPKTAQNAPRVPQIPMMPSYPIRPRLEDLGRYTGGQVRGPQMARIPIHEPPYMRPRAKQYPADIRHEAKWGRYAIAEDGPSVLPQPNLPGLRKYDADFVRREQQIINQKMYNRGGRRPIMPMTTASGQPRPMGNSALLPQYQQRGRPLLHHDSSPKPAQRPTTPPVRMRDIGGLASFASPYAQFGMQLGRTFGTDSWR